MNKKETITNKVNSLITYAVSKGYNRSLLNSLMGPLLTQVNSFYNLDLSGMIETCIKALTHAQIRTGIIYKDGYTIDHTTTGAPAGYSDITDLFDFDNGLMNTTNADFTASIRTTTDATTGAQSYTSQLVTSWLSDFTAAVQSVPSRLKAVAAYANTVGLGDTLKNLLEPSDVESVPKLIDIAAEIYHERKYLTLIRTLDLPIYIPSGITGS